MRCNARVAALRLQRDRRNMTGRTRRAPRGGRDVANREESNRIRLRRNATGTTFADVTTQEKHVRHDITTPIT